MRIRRKVCDLQLETWGEVKLNAQIAWIDFPFLEVSVRWIGSRRCSEVLISTRTAYRGENPSVIIPVLGFHRVPTIIPCGLGAALEQLRSGKVADKNLSVDNVMAILTHLAPTEDAEEVRRHVEYVFGEI